MKLSIPAPPKVSALSKAPKMPKMATKKAPKPFMPRQRRYNPAPNKSMF